MTEQFKPAYRGTYTDLEAVKDQANEWFVEQVRTAAVADPRFSDDERKMAQTFKLRLKCDIDRKDSGYIWNHSRKERADYFYVWKIEHARESWRYDRFVMRKNGTIHIENAVDAMRSQMWSQVRRDRERDVMSQNDDIWNATFNMPLREFEKEYGCDLSLSDTVVGMVQVRLSRWNWDFDMKKTVSITKLREFIAWAESVRDAAKGDQWGADE